MQNLKFLIIGANGFIGEALLKEFKGAGSLLGTYCHRQKPGLVALDVLDKAMIERVFDDFKPTHVIMCANLSGGVGYCETHPKEARKLHFDAVRDVGEASASRDVKFTFISSECVFDGKRESYSENDPTTPLNKYGEFKADSEQWIEENLKAYNIVRTMSVFGWQADTIAPNALMSAYFAINNKSRFFVPTYRYGNPTYVYDLTAAIREMSLSKTNGLFQIVGEDYIQRYEWIMKACESLGWDTAWIEAQEHFPKRLVATYPLKVRLKTDKFKKHFQTKLHRLDEALDSLRAEIEVQIS